MVSKYNKDNFKKTKTMSLGIIMKSKYFLEIDNKGRKFIAFCDLCMDQFVHESSEYIFHIQVF